jgi:hypothetical protein
MTLSSILGTSLIALVVIIALYVWAFINLAKKWRFLTPLGAFLYIVVAFAGPVPMLVLLYLDVGVDRFHSDHFK